jgi:hypothetical protein
LNDKSDNVKGKVLEVLKKKMQLISSKLQPNMINQTNFESVLNQFNKMSIKETVDQVSNQKSGIIEPNASKLKFERDFNSVPNQGNKLMDRPLATAANKNLEKFLYPPGFERESKNSIPDPKFDKLFKPIVDNGSGNVALVSRRLLNEQVVFGSQTAANSENRVSIRGVGRYHRLQLTPTGLWKTTVGMDIDLNGLGTR